MLLKPILFLTFQSVSLVAAGEVQKLLDTYCELIPTLTNAESGLDSSHLAEAVSEKFRALYHHTLDCSWNTGNPIMGYNLIGASYDECLAAEANGMSQGKRLQLGTSVCTETIADETKGTGAFWTLASVVGKDRSIHFAESIQVVNGKIAAYHIDFDTYQFLSHDDEEAHKTDGWSIVVALAAGIVLGMVVTLIGSVVWKKSQYVRLED